MVDASPYPLMRAFCVTLGFCVLVMMSACRRGDCGALPPAEQGNGVTQLWGYSCHTRVATTAIVPYLRLTQVVQVAGETLRAAPTGVLPCSTDADCDQWRPHCKGGKCSSVSTIRTAREADRCSTSTNVCLECLVDGDCEAGEICKNGSCESKSCTPGETAVTAPTC